jgi:hypothetical protein
MDAGLPLGEFTCPIRFEMVRPPQPGRVAVAKQRFSRRHWQARAELKCFLFVCW